MIFTIYYYCPFTFCYCIFIHQPIYICFCITITTDHFLFPVLPSCTTTCYPPCSAAYMIPSCSFSTGPSCSHSYLQWPSICYVSHALSSCTTRRRTTCISTYILPIYSSIPIVRAFSCVLRSFAATCTLVHHFSFHRPCPLFQFFCCCIGPPMVAVTRLPVWTRVRDAAAAAALRDAGLPRARATCSAVDAARSFHLPSGPRPPACTVLPRSRRFGGGASCTRVRLLQRCPVRLVLASSSSPAAVRSRWTACAPPCCRVLGSTTSDGHLHRICTFSPAPPDRRHGPTTCLPPPAAWLFCCSIRCSVYLRSASYPCCPLPLFLLFPVASFLPDVTHALFHSFHFAFAHSACPIFLFLFSALPAFVLFPVLFHRRRSFCFSFLYTCTLVGTRALACRAAPRMPCRRAHAAHVHAPRCRAFCCRALPPRRCCPAARTLPTPTALRAALRCAPFAAAAALVRTWPFIAHVHPAHPCLYGSRAPHGVFVISWCARSWFAAHVHLIFTHAAAHAFAPARFFSAAWCSYAAPPPCPRGWTLLYTVFRGSFTPRFYLILFGHLLSFSSSFAHHHFFAVPAAAAAHVLLFLSPPPPPAPPPPPPSTVFVCHIQFCVSDRSLSCCRACTTCPTTCILPFVAAARFSRLLPCPMRFSRRRAAAVRVFVFPHTATFLMRPRVFPRRAFSSLYAVFVVLMVRSHSTLITATCLPPYAPPPPPRTHAGAHCGSHLSRCHSFPHGHFSYVRCAAPGSGFLPVPVQTSSRLCCTPVFRTCISSSPLFVHLHFCSFVMPPPHHHLLFLMVISSTTTTRGFSRLCFCAAHSSFPRCTVLPQYYLHFPPFALPTYPTPTFGYCDLPAPGIWLPLPVFLLVQFPSHRPVAPGGHFCILPIFVLLYFYS